MAQISKRALNKILENQIFDILSQVLADTNTKEQAHSLLDDFLTKTEKTTLAKRLAIAHYLERGRSYENIKNTLKVSSATISTVQRMMHQKGFDLLLQKINAEQWADKWTQKILKPLNKFIKP
jgi:TrpR-related protein YerC/YecD